MLVQIQLYFNRNVRLFTARTTTVTCIHVGLLLAAEGGSIEPVEPPPSLRACYQPTWLPTRSVQSTRRTRSSSSSAIRIFLITITNRSFTYPSLYCGISSLLHSVNLILFILLIHLMRISPHHSHHLRSYHLSLLRPFTPDLKLRLQNNPFFYSLCLHGSSTCIELSGHWRFFVLVSFYIFLATCAID